MSAELNNIIDRMSEKFDPLPKKTEILEAIALLKNQGFTIEKRERLTKVEVESIIHTQKKNRGARKK